MTKQERLQHIIDCLCNGKNTVMASRLGHKNSSTVGSWVSRGNWDIEQIAYAFPEISIDWLVFGQGPMLKADCRAENYPCQSTDDINPDIPDPVNSGSATNQPLHPDRPYTEQPSTDTSVFTVHEGESVDRALLNMLLHEKTTMMQELAILRQRNLELEKQNAVMADRLDNAEKWYYSYAANKKD